MAISPTSRSISHDLASFFINVFNNGKDNDLSSSDLIDNQVLSKHKPQIE